MFESFLDASGLFFASVLGHLVYVQVFKMKRFFIEAVVFGLLCSIFVSAFTNFLGLFFFLSLWVGYVVAIVGWFNSVTLQYLYQLDRTPDLVLTKAQVCKTYDEKSAFESRYQGLVSSGIIVHRDDRIALTLKGKIVACFVYAFRSIFGVKKIG